MTTGAPKKRQLLQLFFILLAIPLLHGCGNKSSLPADPVLVRINPEIVRAFAHDTSSFTQGLLFDRGFLYESSGLYGKSRLRRLSATDSVVHASVNLHESLFGEGCALMGDNIVQLTWQAGIALVYRLSDFSIVDTFEYAGEGWGLTTDESRFIMSNGSDTLYFRDRQFRVTRSLPVTHNKRPLTRLNELEYARAMIYANVWYNNFIFEIDPRTGRVMRFIDCTEIINQAGELHESAVLNGIAYDPARDIFYVTGKNWPKIFEVRIGRLEIKG